MIGVLVYLRMTDKEGRVTVTEHRCWDPDWFMKARAAEAVKAGGEAKAEQLTQADYQQARAL